MRHLYTLIAAVFIAPLSWVLIAYGQDRSAQAFANAQHDGTLSAGDFVRPVVLLAGAGLLLGLLATLRLSPLGVVLTGAAYAAGYVALLFDPDGVLRVFPHSVSVAGHAADPTTPLRTGTAMLLGALMLVATVSVGRWRRWPSAGEAEPQPTLEPVPDRLPAFDGLGLSPSAPITEADVVTRYPSSPQRSGNSGPNSFERGDDGTDQWHGIGQSTRPRM